MIIAFSWPLTVNRSPLENLLDLVIFFFYKFMKSYVTVLSFRVTKILRNIDEIICTKSIDITFMLSHIHTRHSHVTFLMQQRF